jgi:hypothetical protein
MFFSLLALIGVYFKWDKEVIEFCICNCRYLLFSFYRHYVVRFYLKPELILNPHIKRLWCVYFFYYFVRRNFTLLDIDKKCSIH